MPVPEIQRLSKGSSESQVKAAISACIQMMMNEGRPQDQAVAMCYSMISKKTGKEMAQPQPPQPSQPGGAG